VRFLVDENLSPLVASGLEVAGHDAVHARDVGLTAADDSTVLQVAEADDRIIVSADTDFGTLMAVRGSRRPSIILIRRSLDRRAGSVVSLLLATFPLLSSRCESVRSSYSTPSG
jgi:predicted nuclease of predicted toxin-antitoxin system